jgi:hypothetical protein
MIENEEGIRIMLRQVCQMLSLIPLEDLRKFSREGSHYRAKYDALAPLMDPTAYRNAMYDGSLEDARHQQKIVEKALALLEEIHKRESFVAGFTATNNEDGA